MVAVDPFLLTLTLIMVILLIVGNVYFVAHYSHAADSALGSSTACKFIVVSFPFRNSGGLLHGC